MRNYIQAGDIITVPAPYAVASGDGCFVTAVFGVATNAAAVGAPVEIKTTGVFGLKADPAATAAVGAKAYWDDTALQVSATATANKLIGVFTVAKVAAALTASVRLNGTSI